MVVPEDFAQQHLLCKGHMPAQQFPSLPCVLGGQQLAEDGVTFVVGLLLAAQQVAAHEDIYGQPDKEDAGWQAAKVHAHRHESCTGECHARRDEPSEEHDVSDEEADDESHARRDEPSADDIEDASDAEDRAFACPGTVGQTGAHGHDEGDIGGAQRQSQAGAHDDEQGGQHQVDRGAHQVKGSPFGHDGLLLVESFVEPAEETFGQYGVQRTSHMVGSAHDAPCHGAAAKHLFALLLTAQVDARLHHIVCLLAGGQRHHHHQSCQQQENEGRARTLVERTHHEGRGVCTGCDGEVLVAAQRGQRHTHEVYQVVAGKCHGQGKGAHEDDDAEHIDSHPVEQLHEERAACQQA